VRANAPDAAERVSAAVQATVTLWPLLPATALDHYRRGAPDHATWRPSCAPCSAAPRTSRCRTSRSLPREVFEYESPRARTSTRSRCCCSRRATLEKLAKAAPASRVDVRRFRPNFVVETDAGIDGYVDADWAGRRLRLGKLEIDGAMACPRCVMVSHGFADLPRDPGLLRAIVRDANQNVGLYARPRGEGRLRVGDEVTLVD